MWPTVVEANEKHKIEKTHKFLNQAKCQNTPVTTFKTANTVMTSAGSTGSTVDGSEVPLATWDV